MSSAIGLQDVTSTQFGAVELRQGGALSWNVHVYNAGVYLRTGVGTPGGRVDWREEVFRAPGLYTLDGSARRIDAVQIRAAVAPTSSLTTPRVTIDAET